jgi:hypothetical protein
MSSLGDLDPKFIELLRGRGISDEAICEIGQDPTKLRNYFDEKELRIVMKSMNKLGMAAPDPWPEPPGKD